MKKINEAFYPDQDEKNANLPKPESGKKADQKEHKIANDEAKKIFVLAGTPDVRQIVQHLSERGYKLSFCLPEYKDVELPPLPVSKTLRGKPRYADFVKLFSEESYDLVLDCAHPFASEMPRELYAAAQETNTPYLRYRRPHPEPEQELPRLRYHTASLREAALLVARLNTYLNPGAERPISLAVQCEDLHAFAGFIKRRNFYPLLEHEKEHAEIASLSIPEEQSHILPESEWGSAKCQEYFASVQPVILVVRLYELENLAHLVSILKHAAAAKIVSVIVDLPSQAIPAKNLVNDRKLLIEKVNSLLAK